jgi:MbtH protein
MNDSETKDPFDEYEVVKSIHGDYSIWPSVKKIPSGWESVKILGDKNHCLAWIEENWEGPTLK